jgi:hypothetical protein
MKIFIKFHPKLVWNMNSTGRNSLMPASKWWFSEPIFMKLKPICQPFVMNCYILWNPTNGVVTDIRLQTDRHRYTVSSHKIFPFLFSFMQNIKKDWLHINYKSMLLCMMHYTPVKCKHNKRMRYSPAADVPVSVS